MYVLGLSGLHNSVPFKKREMPGLTAPEYRYAQGFDAAAALVSRDGVLAAAAEERFNREKTTGSFPTHAIRYCLQAAGLREQDIDFVAHGFDYEGLQPLLEQIPYTKRQYEEVYSHQTQVRCGQQFLPEFDWEHRLVQVPHHLAHAASAYYLSGFEECLILVSDGMGEQHSATVATGAGKDIQVLRQIPWLHSLGILYSVFTHYLGFLPGMDEYKVMGLAPYGDPRRHFDALMQFVQPRDDGTYTIPLLYNNRTIEEKETYRGAIGQLVEALGPARQPGAPLTQHHMDVAAALQSVLERCLLHVLRHFQRETRLRDLCLAGGVALNCTANGVIRRSRLFRRMFVQPAAGDDGSSLGAALWVQRQRDSQWVPRPMKLPLWGPCFGGEVIRRALDSYPGCRAVHYASCDALAAEVARQLASGAVVGWFHGRMEFGPRALGSRSILADARDPGMRDRLNRLVKNRESFRPFAPVVTSEDASEYFDIGPDDTWMYSHMLFATQVRPQYRELLPSITHVDGSARVQTVFAAESPRLWTVLRAFASLSGVPILINTSFNVRGQPIVCTPAEALATFVSTGMDVLVMEDLLVSRPPPAVGRQPEQVESSVASR